MKTPELDPAAVETPAKAKPYSFGWLWPSITTEDEAKKASNSGGYAAVIIAVLTCAVSLVSLITKQPFLGSSGWALLDAAIFAVIAWRIFRFSVSWAVVGLLFYLAEVCWRWSKTGVPSGGGIITTGLLVLALISGVRGAAFLNNAKP